MTDSWPFPPEPPYTPPDDEGVAAPDDDGDPNTFHVVPINDLVEHDTTGGDCVCGPTTEPVVREDGTIGWVVTHHSLDGRELREPKPDA